MKMNQNLIYLPCFALFLLTGLVLLVMFFRRVQAVKNKDVKIETFKTYQNELNGPIKMVQASRNFSNLFEVPTLFYMICAFALITQNVDNFFYYTAWAYTILRFIHSLIHLTSNYIPLRMQAYSLSWIALMILATKLFLNII